MTTNWSFLLESKPFIKEVWTKSEFDQPTTIQENTIPFITAGKDVIAESPTGTGKTLAYLLPLLEKIDPEKKAPQAVILASSQELVMQIFTEIQKWKEGSQIRAASFIGGANTKRQLEKLKKHPHIIAGTPGRMSELIKQKKLKMHEVNLIVLDEGDQLLIPEHIKTVESIVKSTLQDRQVVLFSATLPPETIQSAKSMMKDPEVIQVERDKEMDGKVDHVYFSTEEREKGRALAKIARLEGLKAIVFVQDIATLSVVADKLKFEDVQASVLHSDLGKNERKNSLDQFRLGKVNILLTTDVAARGLDIRDVTHVVHYDVPRDLNQYVHRSGRTGRFGAEGTVLSLATSREEPDLKKFSRKLDVPLEKKILYKGTVANEEEKNERNAPRKREKGKK
jgi:superfamily II DNA/RNA helicase